MSREANSGRASPLVLTCILTACTQGMGTADAGNHEDHLEMCREGYVFPVDARDATLEAMTPQQVRTAQGVDVALPDPMLDWLDEHGWPQQHDDWHNIRRWDQGCRKSNASADGCPSAQRLRARGLWRSPRQENAPGDGYDFLVMHRHMLEGMRQAWPRHAGLLAPFTHVPRSQTDPENPMPWRPVQWSAQSLEAIELLENIEQHVSRFATEDDLARYMQASFVWTPESPSAAGEPSGGIHFALHAQWSVFGSPVELGNGRGVIYNAVFWKLHAWLDEVWERYRRARGITAEDPLYRQTRFEQCKEMHDLDERHLVIPGVDGGTGGGTSGVFATQVRPALERRCGTCHGATAPTLGLVVGGGGLSDAEVLGGLVGVKATQVDLKLVEPFAPERSWLYLKAAAQFDGVTCTNCKTPMPPAGQGLSAAELEALRGWIAAGATAQ